MQTPPRRIVNAGTPPAAPYSHAVAADGLIYLSGVIAEDGSGRSSGKETSGRRHAR